MRLGQPAKVYLILNEILEDSSQNYKSIAHIFTNPITYPLLPPRTKFLTANNSTPVLSISERLDSYLIELSDEELIKVIVFCKDWNSNARQCFVAQVVVHALFRIMSLEKLQQLRPFIEALPNFTAYSEKHYERVNRLYQASYLLEYMSSLMTLMPMEEPSNKKLGASTSKLKLDDATFNGLINDDDEYVPCIFSGSAIANDNDTDSSDDDDDDDENLLKGVSKKLQRAGDDVDNQSYPVQVLNPLKRKSSLEGSEIIAIEKSTASSDDVSELKAKSKRKKKSA